MQAERGYCTDFGELLRKFRVLNESIPGKSSMPPPELLAWSSLEHWLETTAVVVDVWIWRTGVSFIKALQRIGRGH